MGKAFQVRVVRRGVITLRKQLRNKNGVAEGDTISLIDLGDGIIVMSPRHSHVDGIANRLAKEWRNSGETLGSMLSALRQVRAKYDAKKP